MKFLRLADVKVLTVILFVCAFGVYIMLGVLKLVQLNTRHIEQRSLLLKDHVNKCYQMGGIWIKIDDENYMCVFPRLESSK